MLIRTFRGISPRSSKYVVAHNFLFPCQFWIKLTVLIYVRGIDSSSATAMWNTSGKSTDHSQTVHMLFNRVHVVLWISCSSILCCVDAMTCRASWGAVRVGQSAYNEAPAIAVANDCWFRARRHQTRPFFFYGSLIHKHLQNLLDESHQKFFDHCAH
jgi:hypothetical protein